MKKLILVAAVFAFTQPSFGGKTDDIVKACGGKVTKKQAAKMIKDVFLRCNPGSKVQSNGCELDCMKGNAGAKIGG